MGSVNNYTRNASLVIPVQVGGLSTPWETMTCCSWGKGSYILTSMWDRTPRKVHHLAWMEGSPWEEAGSRLGKDTPTGEDGAWAGGRERALESGVDVHGRLISPTSSGPWGLRSSALGLQLSKKPSKQAMCSLKSTSYPQCPRLYLWIETGAPKATAHTTLA